MPSNPLIPAGVKRREPLHQIATQLREGAVTATELLTRCVAADQHGAFIAGRDEQGAERARQQALAVDAALKAGSDLGPLMGLPYGVKDIFGVPGIPVFAGSAKPLPSAWQAPGPMVQATEQQLGVMVGKTHTVCFAYGGVGLNSQWDTPKNPWDSAQHRAPGGSSSGSGVSVAEGSSLYAFGTDTGGSVRVPASVNGLVGYKSTAGYLSTAGIVPLSTTLDSAGLLARSMDDVAFVMGGLRDDFVMPPLPSLNELRVHALTGRFLEDTDPGILVAYQRALEVLGKAVGQLVTQPSAVAEEALALFEAGSVGGVELAARLDNQLAAWWDGLDPLVSTRIAASREMPAHTYLDRRYQIQSLTARMTSTMVEQATDIMVLPTLPITPPVLDDLTADDSGEAYSTANMSMLRNTCFANITGMCGVSLPIGLDNHGMPVGIQLLAPGGQDRRLLAIAAACEAAFADAGLWPLD